jgi:hypothetical protein
LGAADFLESIIFGTMGREVVPTTGRGEEHAPRGRAGAVNDETHRTDVRFAYFELPAFTFWPAPTGQAKAASPARHFSIRSKLVNSGFG